MLGYPNRRRYSSVGRPQNTRADVMPLRAAQGGRRAAVRSGQPRAPTGRLLTERIGDIAGWIVTVSSCQEMAATLRLDESSAASEHLKIGAGLPLIDSKHSGMNQHVRGQSSVPEQLVSLTPSHSMLTSQLRRDRKQTVREDAIELRRNTAERLT